MGSGKSIEVDYSKDSREKEVRVPGSIFDHINFDDDPATWVDAANDALRRYDRDIAGVMRFIVHTDRRIEDRGPGDVREIYENSWAREVDADLADEDPVISSEPG